MNTNVTCFWGELFSFSFVKCWKRVMFVTCFHIRSSCVWPVCRKVCLDGDSLSPTHVEQEELKRFTSVVFLLGQPLTPQCQRSKWPTRVIISAVGFASSCTIHECLTVELPNVNSGAPVLRRERLSSIWAACRATFSSWKDLLKNVRTGKRSRFERRCLLRDLMRWFLIEKINIPVKIPQWLR